jgi:hypothetical protein
VNRSKLDDNEANSGGLPPKKDGVVVARYSFRAAFCGVEGKYGGGPAYPIRDSDSPVTRGPGAAIVG